MKAKVTVLVIIGILLVSCGAEPATKEIEVVTEASVTQASTTQASVAQELVVTEEFVVGAATEAPTEPSLICITLLTPPNGSDLPVTGRVAFSWTKMDGAASYVLIFILPSSQTASFETDQTSRDRYMEAFVTGGEYRWQVTAQGADGSEICVSEVYTFEKPAYEQPKQPESSKKDENNSNNDGNDSDSGEVPCEDTPDGCSGNH